MLRFYGYVAWNRSALLYGKLNEVVFYQVKYNITKVQTLCSVNSVQSEGAHIKKFHVSWLVRVHNITLSHVKHWHHA